MIALGVLLLLGVVGALASGTSPDETNVATDATTTSTTEDESTTTTEEESTTTSEATTTTQRPTTTQAPAQKPTPAPIALAGTGKTASQSFPIAGGMTIFRTEHRGASNFSVTLLTSDGERVALLVNEIGGFNGSAGLGVRPGQYVLQVEADGPWKANIEQPRPVAGDPLPKTYTGKGQSVAGPFQGEGGGVRFTLMHRGSSNFSVLLFDGDGNREALLANEIGNYDGTELKRLDRGVFWLAIEADGDWKVDLAKS